MRRTYLLTLIALALLGLCAPHTAHAQTIVLSGHHDNSPNPPGNGDGYDTPLGNGSTSYLVPAGATFNNNGKFGLEDGGRDTITISGGTFSGNGAFSGGTDCYGAHIASGSISGGTFSNNTNHGAGLNAGTISGGTFSGNALDGAVMRNGTISGGIFKDNKADGAVIQSDGTISGGTFSGNGRYGAYISGTISGGTFSGNALDGAYTLGDLITGGTFSGNSYGIEVSYEGTISGGTFSGNTKADFYVDPRTRIDVYGIFDGVRTGQTKTLNADATVQSFHGQLQFAAAPQTFTYTGSGVIVLNGVDLPPLAFQPVLRTQINPTVRLRQGYSLSASLQKFDAAVHMQGADGTPKKGVRVLITLASKDNSAGHVETEHTTPRVHGWLFKKGAALKDAAGHALDTTTSVPQDTLGGDTTTTGLTLYTDANGDAPFTYVAPEVAGQDTFTATLPDHKDVAALSAALAVSVTGLVSMKTVTDFPFALYGVTDAHPANWFAAPGTVGSLRATATAYASNQTADTDLQTAITSLRAYGYDFPNQQPHDTNRGGIIVPSANEILFLNDISLPLGGLFDVTDNGGTYLASYGNDLSSYGHGGHRDGTNCDIKSNHLVKGAPYTLSVHAIASIASLSSALGDTRLEGAKSPFTNTDFYTNSGGHKVFYTSAIRAQMDTLVKQIHHERLVQLIHALQAQNASFSNESDHIHVKM